MIRKLIIAIVITMLILPLLAWEDKASVKTINGDLELKFPRQPVADFYLKTFNGKMYSDYEVEYLPQTPVKGTKKEGRFIYKRNRFQGVRIGSGGTRIKMDTLNGNIYIAQKTK